MNRRSLNAIVPMIFVGGLMLMATFVLAGCVNHETVNIPDNAPIWTSAPITVKDPFYLAPGNIKTQAHGSYVRPLGSLVYTMPATQPAK